MCYGSANSISDKILTMNKPDIIVLCASHINNKKRADLLYRMLGTQMSQTHLCKIYVSVTGLPIKYDYNFHAQKYVTIFQQPDEKLSQFTHYHRLINTLFDNGIIKPNTYILFTDDDDDIHTKRNELYYNYLCKYPNLDMILLENSITRVCLDTLPFYGGESYTSGRIKLNWQDEYVSWCISGIVAKTLINILSPNALNEYTCDILFMNLLMACPWNTKTIMAPHPLYYYNYSILLPKCY